MNHTALTRARLRSWTIQTGHLVISIFFSARHKKWYGVECRSILLSSCNPQTEIEISQWTGPVHSIGGRLVVKSFATVQKDDENEIKWGEGSKVGAFWRWGGRGRVSKSRHGQGPCAERCMPRACDAIAAPKCLNVVDSFLVFSLSDFHYSLLYCNDTCY